MNFRKVAAVILVALAGTGTAVAQNTTRNIGPGNIGGPPQVQPQPVPQPCVYNCYGGGSREQIIGGVVGGIIGGIIGGARNRRQQQNQQQYVQQPVQPGQQQQQQAGFSQVQQGGGLSPQHYQYCQNRYRSYVVQTNSYTSYSGQTRYCNSPFN